MSFNWLDCILSMRTRDHTALSKVCEALMAAERQFSPTGPLFSKHERLLDSRWLEHFFYMAPGICPHSRRERERHACQKSGSFLVHGGAACLWCLLICMLHAACWQTHLGSVHLYSRSLHQPGCIADCRDARPFIFLPILI